jgi:hypothetical protein
MVKNGENWRKWSKIIQITVKNKYKWGKKD